LGGTNTMKLRVSQKFVVICQRIVDTDWTESEWAAHEADDWFQTDHFDGGYDATENAFCFSYVRADLCEYWLQLTLPEVHDVLAGRIQELSARLAG
jgi:hypothetical protein